VVGRRLAFGRKRGGDGHPRLAFGCEGGGGRVGRGKGDWGCTAPSGWNIYFRIFLYIFVYKSQIAQNFFNRMLSLKMETEKILKNS